MKIKNNIEKLIEKVLEESLSKGDSPITEANLTKAQLDKREDYLKQLKKNKKELVKRYGKDAESVMYGRATNLAKKAVSEMNKEKLKELVRKSLMNETQEFSEEDIKSYMDTFKVSREEAIKGLQQSYEDYKSEMGEGKKSFPDLTGDGKVTKADILKGRGVKLKEGMGGDDIEELAFALGYDSTDEFFRDNPGAVDVVMGWAQSIASKDREWKEMMMAANLLEEDIDLGHEDNEPHMIKGELYQIGKYAMELYAVLEELEEAGGEYDFPAWWQAKITTAKENLDGAKHYLEFEMNEPKIDAAVDALTGEEPHMGEPIPPMMNEDEIGKDEILAGRLYKIKNFVQPAFYQKVRSLINSGDLETAEFFIKRMEPAAAKNDMEMAKMKGDLEDIDAVAAQRKKERQMANIFAEEIKDKVAKKLKEGLPKGYFKKELGIGGKKKVKEGSYPFDKCLKDQTAKYGVEGAKKVCGALKAAYGE